jgi:hypothetical protein
MSGAQPVEVFSRVLEKAHADAPGRRTGLQASLTARVRGRTHTLPPAARAASASSSCARGRSRSASAAVGAEGSGGWDPGVRLPLAQVGEIPSPTAQALGAALDEDDIAIYR